MENGAPAESRKSSKRARGKISLRKDLRNRTSRNPRVWVIQNHPHSRSHAVEGREPLRPKPRGNLREILQRVR